MSESSFSPKEAAVLAGISEKAIRHEMARGIATPRNVRAGKSARRLMNASDVFYLSLVAALPVSFRPEDRRDLYALIRRRLPKRGRWALTARRLRFEGKVGVEIDVSKIRSAVGRRVKLYERGRSRIVSDPGIVGGEPVFAGTRIPVRHIGLLAAGGTALAEIQEDYPALELADIEFARLYAQLRPDPGRPRKALEFRRAH